METDIFRMARLNKIYLCRAILNDIFYLYFYIFFFHCLENEKFRTGTFLSPRARYDIKILELILKCMQISRFLHLHFPTVTTQITMLKKWKYII